MNCTQCITTCDEVTYVLLCKGNIYYVGKTTQLHNRLRQHWSGNGSITTKINPPIKVLAIYAGDVEKEKAKYGRKKYGEDNCFGWLYNYSYPESSHLDDA